MSTKNFLSLPKTLVLVGMMGVGKTSVGRRLAKQLKVEFYDSDQEVENAAGCSVSDIYDWYGESAFIDTERRVISRLFDKEPHILSTGVGAFINDDNRQLIKNKGFSVWLYASLDTIYPRVARRHHRPQLEGGDKRDNLKQFIDQYYPVYEEADFKVNCDEGSPEYTVETIIKEIKDRYWV